jgi:hypothetical protein
MRLGTIATAAVLTLLSARCATMSNGPTQRIHVDSVPSGSIVRTADCGPGSTAAATTPATLHVSRRATQCELRFTKTGYQDRVLRLSRHIARDAAGRPDVFGQWCADCDGTELVLMSWAYAIILVPSLAVDFATGAMYELDPPRVVDLRPEIEHPQH